MPRGYTFRVYEVDNGVRAELLDEGEGVLDYEGEPIQDPMWSVLGEQIGSGPSDIPLTVQAELEMSDGQKVVGQAVLSYVES